MKKEVKYKIVTPDGDERLVSLPKLVAQAGAQAPPWLVERMGLRQRAGEGWRLRPLAPGGVPRLALTCKPSAGALGGSYDPRQARLEDEYRRLMKLNQESDYVRVKEIDRLEGSAPVHYLVIFICRGIIGINPERQPLFGDRHEVEIYCDIEFPSEPPQLRWRTPSWHPNINHKTGAVCINKPEWLGGMRIDDLCRMMFEMVQYKNYHVQQVEPWPLDQTVAEWVRDIAEPLGIVDKNRRIFVDDKPFTRPTVTDIRLTKKEPILLTPSGAGEPPAASPEGAPLRIRLTNMGNRPAPQQTPAPGVGRIKIIGKRD
jgi:ubiquitin-protein ligase